MKVVWHTPANLDLVALAEYHAAYSVSLGETILQRIESQIALLERFPYIDRAGRIHGTRERIIPGTPYLIVYRMGQNEIGILNILHGARKFPPGTE